MKSVELELEADHLIDFLSIPDRVVNQCILTVREEGIQIKSVDDAHVCMAEVFLEEDIFDDLTLDSENEKEIGINLEKLDKFLKLIKKETVKVKETGKGKLWVQGGDFDRHIPTIDLEGMRRPTIPDYDGLNNEIIISGGQYKKAIKAASTVADHITVKSGKGYFEIESEKDGDDVSMTLAKDQVRKLESEEDECESKFPLDYLQAVSKEIDNDTDITIKMGSDHPIEIDWTFSKGHGYATFLVAPRIEQSDDTKDIEQEGSQ